jgi:lycopene cyclase domain-containing protein
VTYTDLAVIGVAAAAAVDLLLLRTRMLTRKAFWTAYGIVLVFQVLVNGLLAGTGFVRYNPLTFTGRRVFFQPVEDLLFGFAMILTTLSVWVWLGRRLAAGSAGPG